MYRIDNDTAAASLPTPAAAGTPGYFTEGNPSGGQPATVVDADWANAVQEELMAVVEEAGLTGDKTDNAQLLAALQALFSTGNKNVPKFVCRIGAGGGIVWASDAGITSALDATGRYTVTFPDAFASTSAMAPLVTVETNRQNNNKTATWQITSTTQIGVNIQVNGTDAYDNNEFTLSVWGDLA
jgi:hypothetical protein